MSHFNSVVFLFTAGNRQGLMVFNTGKERSADTLKCFKVEVSCAQNTEPVLPFSSFLIDSQDYVVTGVFT